MLLTLDWSAIIGGVAAIAAILLGSQTIRAQVRSEHLSRGLTTMIACEQRYRELEYVRMRKNDPETLTPGDIKSFFRAFWSLKADQFDYFLAGYVDYDTFNDWCDSIARHFRKAEEPNFFGITFMEGWVHVARKFHKDLNPLFVAFHDAIQMHELPKPGAPKIVASPSRIADLIERLDADNNISGLFVWFYAIKPRRWGAANSWIQYRAEIDKMKDNIKSDKFGYFELNKRLYSYRNHQKWLSDAWQRPKSLDTIKVESPTIMKWSRLLFGR